MSSFADFIEFLEPGTIEALETVDNSESLLELYITENVSLVETVVPEELELIDAGPAIAGSGSSYTHTQLSAASTWIITHNLGRPKEPTVLLDDRPTIPVLTDVEHGSLDQTTITFPSPVTGKAYF